MEELVNCPGFVALTLLLTRSLAHLLTHFYSNMTLDEIDKINRFSYDKAEEENGVYETKDPLIIQELLWSDPGDHTGFKKSGRGGCITTSLLTHSLTYLLTQL